jgi:hypothetical protein
MYRLRHESAEVYNMTVAASAGIQNGMMSRYSGNILRVGHVTGGCVDIGVHTGRYVMGHTENVWKIQILVSLVFCFWLGGVFVRWVDPLLDNGVLLINAAYMICIATTYMLYWHITGFKKTLNVNGTTALGDQNDLIVNADPREKSEASFSSTHVVTASRSVDASLVFVNDTDSDFNLTQRDIDQLRVSVPVTSTSEPLPLQARDAKEFSFIMIGASLLALNAGCINAIAVLSPRVIMDNE